MLKPCTAHTLSLAHDRRCWEFCGSFSAVGRQSSRVSALAARLARLEGKDDEARRWMTRASHSATEADWSDIDPDGRLFAYTAEDWKRMVYVFGDEGRLTHPRYERFERYAEAVPENALIEAPRPKAAAASRARQAPAYADTTPRMPDDPGVDSDDDDRPGP